MPWIFMLLRILAAKGSMVRAKRRGDKGQPCLVPFRIWNLSEFPPGSFTIADGFWYSAFTPSKYVSLKPNFSNVLVRKSQSILSNAFSASKLSNIALELVRWTCSIMSKIFLVLSEA
ncbi:hypothetical protein FKM82_023985 [Ascaphus truei]